MERLGFCGIIKLTIHVMFKHLKHFLCIALLLAFSSTFNLLVFGPPWKTIQTLLASTSLISKIHASGVHLDPAEADLTPQERSPPHHPHPALIIFPSLISFLCTLLVTFSVCRACINRRLDLKGSLRGVPRSAINFLLTELLVFAVFFASFTVAILVMVIIAAGLSAVHANVVIPMTIMTIGMVGVVMYMTILFSLAVNVAILEEKKGWEAMRSSMYLITGSRRVAVGLYIFYGVLTMVPLSVYVSEDGSVVWRWCAGAVIVGLQAAIALCSMVSHVVLYMSCKRGHGEALDTLLAASSQFGPQDEMAPKYLDLEAAAIATE